MTIRWTDQQIEDLKRLWAEGHAASAIGQRFGVSRNAILGKVHRLVLPSRTERASVKQRPKFEGGKGGTPQAARAAAAAASNKRRGPKITLATPATKIAEETPTINSGQKHQVPAGPLGREECMTAQLGPSISASSGVTSGRAVEPGSPVHFMDLKLRSCRRPLWGNERPAFGQMFFCGRPTSDPSSSWCLDCLEKVTRLTSLDEVA